MQAGEDVGGAGFGDAEEVSAEWDAIGGCCGVGRDAGWIRGVGRDAVGIQAKEGVQKEIGEYMGDEG